MMRLGFSGWFQCRLATDPDPTDEPRGVSGWTYALPGEPDLDRIIRTQPTGAVPRKFGPQIGVAIDTVVIDGQPVENHVLNRAKLILLSDPAFEGRNGISSEDTEEPIFPFHMRIDGSDVQLEREFRELDSGEWTFKKATGVEQNLSALQKAGIAKPDDYILKRKSDIEEELKTTKDPLEKLRLESRLRHLTNREFGPVPMFIGLRYRYILDGPWFKVRDGKDRLGGTIESSPWIFTTWIGCWDADALCGFMLGELVLPFRPNGQIA